MSLKQSWISTIKAVSLCSAMLVLSARHLPAQHVIPWRSVLWNESFEASRSGSYVLDGNAVRDSIAEVLILTHDTSGQRGRIYSNAVHNAAAFDVSFRAYFGGRGSGVNTGADGIVFALTTDPSYAGSYGGSIDFDGSGGLGFEFDTYYNPELSDPNEEHFGLIEDLTSNHLHVETTSTGTLKNNGWHNIHIRNRNGLFRAWLDGQDRYTWTVPTPAAKAWHYGFTSATGISHNPHMIDDVHIEVPTARSTSFGFVSMCDPIPLDTTVSIVNNLPDGEQLRILSISLTELDGSGEFQMPILVFPIVLDGGGVASVRITCRPGVEGLRRVVLTAMAENGEVLRDTLSIDAVLPHLSWSPVELEFPRVHTGRTSYMKARLTNTGTIPYTIQGTLLNNPVFAWVSPAVFPITVQPGGSIDCTISASPLTEGPQTDTLKLLPECGRPYDLPISTIGYIETIRIGFSRPPLMLLPSGSGTTDVVVRDGPNESFFRGFTSVLVYDHLLARFDSASLSGSEMPNGTFLSAHEISPGIIAVDIHSPTLMQTPGRLCRLSFTALAGESSCAPVFPDSVFINPYGPVVGAPRYEIDTSTICINASCRNPEGVIRIVKPEHIAVTPNPVHDRATIRVTLRDSGPILLTLHNSSGMLLNRIADGVFGKGDIQFVIQCGSLPAGTYFVRMTSATGSGTTGLSVVR